jgi:hypothetical protein
MEKASKLISMINLIEDCLTNIVYSLFYAKVKRL